MTTHLLVDGEGKPLSFEVTSAKGNEKQQVEKLSDPHLDKLKRLYDLHQVISILEIERSLFFQRMFGVDLDKKLDFIVVRKGNLIGVYFGLLHLSLVDFL